MVYEEQEEMIDRRIADSWSRVLHGFSVGSLEASILNEIEWLRS